MSMANDIQYNMENDLDKTESVTAYLTELERSGLEQYCARFDLSLSDAAGSWIWRGLKQAGYLPEGYRRPAGF